jgi:hypothetical protein
VRYNERGEGGRYLGITERLAVFYAGSLNQFVETNLDLCAKAVYQPFPEAEKMVP